MPAPQNMMWEVSVQDNLAMNTFDDPSDPAGESDYRRGLNLDAQIKAYEAYQAAQARHMQELERLRRPASRRNIHFADELLLYSSNRTQLDVQCMWYTRDELAAFKNERKNIVKILKRANFDLAAVEQTGLYCLRGYEAYFSMEINKAMKYARKHVVSVVTSEQQRQINSGVYFDDTAMRNACNGSSQWALENALLLGSNDEADAYGEDEECCSMAMDESTNNLYFDNDYDTSDGCSHQSYSTGNCTVARMETDTAVQQQHPDNDPRSAMEREGTDENLAERLESALKLVQALRYGSTPPIS